MKKGNEYLFGMCGSRNGIQIETVYTWLKEKSENFTETTEYGGTGVTWTNYEGTGTLNGIEFKYRAFFASMGLPSLDIYTNTYSDDKNIRKLIWQTGWKGN